MIYVFREPVSMVVISPVFGKIGVRAYCLFDAKMQAAAMWGTSMDALGKVQIGVDKEAVERMKNESIDCADGSKID